MRSLLSLVVLFVLLFSAVSSHKVPLYRKRHAPSLSPYRRTIKSDTLFSSLSIVAPIYIGTPAQELFVILDTSSADLAIFSTAYTSQYKASSSSSSDDTSLGKAFDSSASSSFNAAGQTFTNTYGSGSTQTYFEADEAKETISIENYTLTEQTFGLVSQGNVSYGPFTSGILGLAFEAASTGMRTTPPVQQLFFDGAFSSPVFSFALMRPSTEMEKTSESAITQPGGIFTLGNLDTDQYQGPLGWSPLVTPSSDASVPTKWLTKLDNITVNGALVDGSSGMVANYDTGSSATRASGATLDTIFANVEGAYKDQDGTYYLPCGSDTSSAMNVTLSMGGVSVDIEPLDLLYKTQPYMAQGVTYCQSTLSATSSTDYDIQIGDDFLRSLFVAFQYEPPRVGIAAQSVNVHNQGAKPTYAFGAVQPLRTAALVRPSASASASRVSVQSVAPSATTHVDEYTEEGDAVTIQKGGLYVATLARPIATLSASSTPVEIAPTVSTTPGAADATLAAGSSGTSSSASSSSSTTLAPSHLSLTALLVSATAAILFLDRWTL